MRPATLLAARPHPAASPAYADVVHTPRLTHPHRGDRPVASATCLASLRPAGRTHRSLIPGLSARPRAQSAVDSTGQKPRLHPRPASRWGNRPRSDHRAASRPSTPATSRAQYGHRSMSRATFANLLRHRRWRLGRGGQNRQVRETPYAGQIGFDRVRHPGQRAHRLAGGRARPWQAADRDNPAILPVQAHGRHGRPPRLMGGEWPLLVATPSASHKLRARPPPQLHQGPRPHRLHAHRPAPATARAARRQSLPAPAAPPQHLTAADLTGDGLPRNSSSPQPLRTPSRS